MATIKDLKTTQSEIAKIFLTFSDINFYSEALDLVLEELDAEFGYFGYIDERGDLICPSMTRNIWSKCSVKDKNIVFPKETWVGNKNIWGRSIEQKKTIYSNSPRKVPHGHLPIKNVLVVPIIFKHHVIGQFAVANKSDGFSQSDINFLENVADFVSPILNAKLDKKREKILREKLEKKLQKSENNFKILNDVFLSFSENPRRNIQRLVQTTRELLDADWAFYNKLVTKDNELMIDSYGINKDNKEMFIFENAAGFVCTDVIQENMQDLVIFEDIDKTKYAITDDFLIKQNIKKYVGGVIRIENEPIADFCILYEDNRKLSDSDKNIFQILVESATIEEKRLLEKEELRKSEKRFKALFNNATDAIFIHDLEGNISQVNNTVADRLGYSKNELTSMNIEEIDTSENRKLIQNRMDDLRKDKSLIFETTHLTKSGKKIPTEVNAKLVQYNGYNFIISLARDITKRKKIEKEVRESRELYKKAYNRAEFYKDLFAHDINNILQNIKSGIDLLSIWTDKYVYSDEMIEVFNIINEQVVRGAGLVSNIRNLSNLNNVEVNLKPINLKNCLEEAINFVKKSYFNKNLNIKINNIEENIIALANKLITDVFENIIFNAIKYNQNEKIKISIEISEDTIDNEQYWKLEFRDNGMGISDDMKKKLFGTQIRDNKLSKGMGLGLLTVKKILDIYNGEIWVEDRIPGRPSEGSNFVIRLPKEG
ncbi:MAG: PAS domain S-box protein [Candidatus Lokiarchaeota archaeon]|nr:PAS domain S-box protein [Candidatus Lokiarchaeota archaeon]